MKLHHCIAIISCGLFLAVSLTAAAPPDSGAKESVLFSANFDKGAGGWTGVANDKKDGLSKWWPRGGVRGGAWSLSDPGNKWASMSSGRIDVKLGAASVLHFKYKASAAGLLHIALRGRNRTTVYSWDVGFRPKGDAVAAEIGFIDQSFKLPSLLEGAGITGINLSIKNGACVIDEIALVSRKGSGIVKSDYDPEIMALLRPPGRAINVLVLQGLYHKQYRLDDAFEHLRAKFGKVGVRVKTVQFRALKNSMTRISAFPKTVEELMLFDVVILANVDGRCFGASANGGRFLKSFVKTGGGLLILGGMYAYGQGYYDPLKEMIPFRLAGPFDIRRVNSRIFPTDKSSPLLRGVAEKNWPVCIYAHDLGLKKGASSHLGIKGKTFLATQTFGKGRVTACSGTVYGEAGKSAVAFWKWKQWPVVLGNTVEWLAQRPKKQTRDPYHRRSK